MQVNFTLTLPPATLHLPLASAPNLTAPVSPPTAHWGPGPVHTRLISYELREGQVRKKCFSFLNSCNERRLFWFCALQSLLLYFLGQWRAAGVLPEGSSPHFRVPAPLGAEAASLPLAAHSLSRWGVCCSNFQIPRGKVQSYGVNCWRELLICMNCLEKAVPFKPVSIKESLWW